MLFQTPKFWSNINFYSNILLPFSYLFQLISLIKFKLARPYRSPIKVICVGNLTCGGGGKTPVAIEIAKILKERNIKVAFLSRGYGGSAKGPIKVDYNFHTASYVGDEPLLLAKIAPVYLAKNKLKAIKLAEANKVEVIIMDDGLQNYSLCKDLKILTIDGEFGFGNGRLIPAGPLRETSDNLTKMDLIIILGKDKFQIKEKFDDLNIIQANYKAIDSKIDKDKNYIAFAGIARPSKFFETLKKLNINIVLEKKFPDHYYYRQSDIEQLKMLAYKYKASLITTEKDIVRIQKYYHNEIFTLPIEIDLDKEYIKNLLKI
ncbi:MAG: tetraacyldisaccharide 4'-kinase [Alphaproteobacteria bacterium]